MSYTFQVQTEEKGASESDPKRPGYWGGTGILGGPFYSDRDRTRRSPTPPEVAELYQSIVYICTKLNANAFSKIRLRLYSLTKGNHSRIRLYDHEVNGVSDFQKNYIKSIPELAPYTKGAIEIEEIVEHPLLEAVMAPNDRWDHVSLMRYVSTCLDLFGRSHWWMEAFNGLRPKNTWPLLSQYVYPQKQGKYELVEYYTYGGMVIPEGEVLEVREISARDPYALGLGAAEASFMHSDLFNMFVSYERNMFEQGAAPKMLIFNKDPDAPLGRVERERLQRDINYGLVRGAQGISWVVDGNLDVKVLSFMPEGMAKLNIGNESLQRVANAFGVPVSFIDIGNANRSISESDKKTHAELAIDPRCALVASAMTKWTRAHGRRIDDKLKAAGSKVRSNFDRLVWAFDNPIPENEEQKTKVLDMKIRNGSYTINMALAAEGLPPVPWGNEPWIQLALTQPSIAKWQRENGATGKDGKPRSGAMPSNAPPKVESEGKPALPKPASDELEEGSEEEVVPPKKKPKKGLVARSKAPRKDWEADWPLIDTLVHAALLEIGLGHEDRYEDEVITQEQRLEALHELRLNCRSLLRALGDEALADILEAEDSGSKAFGKRARAAIDKFFKDSKRFIKASIVAASLLVLGPGSPSKAELDGIEEAQTRQVEYLDKFKTATLNGEQAMDGDFAARIELYGGAIWGEGLNLLRKVAIGANVFEDEARFHVGEDVPCDTCIEQQDEGWQPIGTLEAIGSSECLVNCHCHFLYRDADGNEWLAGRGPLEEIAFGATA